MDKDLFLAVYVFGCSFYTFAIYRLLYSELEINNKKKHFRVFKNRPVFFWRNIGGKEENNIRSIVMCILVGLTIGLANYVLLLNEKGVREKAESIDLSEYPYEVLGAYIALIAIVILLRNSVKQISIPVLEKDEQKRIRSLYNLIFWIGVLCLICNFGEKYYPKASRGFLFFHAENNLLLYVSIICIMITAYMLVRIFFDFPGVKHKLNRLFYWMKQNINEGSGELIEFMNIKFVLMYYIKQLNFLDSRFEFCLEEITKVELIKFNEIGNNKAVHAKVKGKGLVHIGGLGLLVDLGIVVYETLYFKPELTIAKAALLVLTVLAPLVLLLFRGGTKRFTRIYYGKELLCLRIKDKTHISGGKRGFIANSWLNCYCWIIFNMISLYLLSDSQNCKFDPELWDKYLKKISNEDTCLIINQIIANLKNKHVDFNPCGSNDVQLASGILDLYFSNLNEANITKEELLYETLGSMRSHTYERS